MRAKKNSFSTKAVVMVLAVVLVLGCAIGGTIAWLTHTTEPVVNKFTFGDINITLTESKDLNLKIVPGVDITKDPVVTVIKDSEACYLFVKIEETNWSDKLTYKLADGWTALDGFTGVYYREVAASAADQPFFVLADNKIAVSTDLKKGEITTAPTLTFTAYAVQSAEVASAAAAWAIANPTP